MSSNNNSGDNNGAKSGNLGASLNLLNSIIGAGVVGLPYATRQCGLVAGIVLMVFLALLIEKSIVLLIETGIRENKRNVEELGLVLFGGVGYYLSAIFMFSYSFGSMIACMVVVGDTVPFAIKHLFGVAVDREIAMILFGIVVVLPFCLLRDISSLSSASLLALVAVIVLVALVCVRGPVVSEEQGIGFGSDDITIIAPRVFAGMGTISFHYVCQQSAFLVFNSMEDDSIESWKFVSRVSMFLACFLSFCIGIVGYLSFGSDTEGNILNNFSDTGISLCMSLV